MFRQPVPTLSRGVEREARPLLPSLTLGADPAPAVVVAPPATTAPLHCVRAGCSADRAGGHTVLCAAHLDAAMTRASEYTSQIGRGDRR